jgi:hypothetical protein
MLGTAEFVVGSAADTERDSPLMGEEPVLCEEGSLVASIEEREVDETTPVPDQGHVGVPLIVVQYSPSSQQNVSSVPTPQIAAHLSWTRSRFHRALGLFIATAAGDGNV